MSDEIKRIKQVDRKSVEAKEVLPGIYRQTLTWNEEAMTCHFLLSKGAAIPLHKHPAVQSGYVLRGRVRFQRGDAGETFIAEAGTSYVFDGEEEHAVEVLEETEIIEFFTPMRPEYC
jgi:quercetin dioxygenase-like cupin family protein